MLRISELRCERGRRLLFSNVTLSLQSGQLLRVEGTNGSGKTTLLRILCGLYDEYEGTIEWDLDDYPLYVGHRPGVKDVLTPFENLRWLCGLYGSRPGAGDIHEALAAIGLDARHDVPCGQLSEGQRKRVNLARLFLLDSPAWILDEPFSAIDRDGVARLTAAIDQRLDTGGIVLLTSHQQVLPAREPVIVTLGAT